MERPRGVLVAALVAFALVATGFIVMRQNDERKAHQQVTTSPVRSNATIDPANPPGATEPNVPVDDPGSSASTSSESLETPVPTEATNWQPGMSGYAAYKFVQERASTSYRDPSPVDWVRRAKKFATPQYAQQNLDWMLEPRTEEEMKSDSDWTDMQKSQSSYGAADLTVEWATPKHDGDTQEFTVMYRQRLTEGGKTTMASTYTTFNAVVSKVGGQWLVSDLRLAASGL